MTKQFQYFTIDFENSDKIMIASFNRPPVNALNLEAFKEFSKLTEIVFENREICTLILRSEGQLFSAGADTNELKALTPEELELFLSIARKASSDLYKCSVPVISAVQGGAVGSGAMLAACGDIILASEEAFFSLAEVDLGLVGGAGPLSRFLPSQKIRMMSLTGMKVDALEAYRLGGKEKIVSFDNLFDTALEYAEKLAEKGSKVMRAWKDSLLVTEGIDPHNSFLIEHLYSEKLNLLLQST